MAGAHRTATVRASEDVEVLRLPREAFDALVDLHPEIADALSAHIRMQEILRVLRLHPAFSALSLNVLSQFLQSFETLDVAAGDVIVHERESRRCGLCRGCRQADRLTGGQCGGHRLSTDG